ncbi:unnamed protein product [Cylindrotheca closterium]|uniref:Protein kinase domain-containing protein n=1 Tax=Cylindrotheca closterium TaxID=2856 RepID=A0AAD2FJ30_9STRA|nr:unnamed protein product [Cylindrotheca closterium]
MDSLDNLDRQTHKPRDDSNVRLSRSFENEDPDTSFRSHGSSFLPNPQISASPEGYGKKKIWEGAYKSFLSKGRGKNSSNSLDLDSSSPSSKSSSDTKGLDSKKKSASFSMIPGSKRLVSRSSPNTPQRHKTTTTPEGEPPLPQRTSIGQRVRSFGTKSHESGDGNMDSSVRGGTYFKSVFKRKTGVTKRNSKSDELDAPLRNGIGRSSGSPEYHAHGRIARGSPEYATGRIPTRGSPESGSAPESVDDISIPTTTNTSRRRVISEDEDDIGLDYLVESGSVTSLFGLINYGSSTQLSVPSMNPLGEETEGITDDDAPTGLPALLPPQNISGLRHSASTGGLGLSLLSQEIQHQSTPQMMYHDPSAAGGDYGHRAAQPSSSSPNTLVSLLSEPSFTIGSSSPSSLVYQQNVDPETKKMFTMYHNDARFSRDTTEPFLGDDVPASQRNYAPMAYMAATAGVRRFAAHSRVASETYIPSMLHDPLPLAPVDENGISVQHNMRLLKPLHSTEHWEAGRRYLIAAAALATCPVSVMDKVSGTTVHSPKEAAISHSAFGTINLGKALVTYVGQTRHLSAGTWSSCNLVLRQNYLLEYDVDAPKNALPRGFAHLQLATAYASPELPNSLELHFFASPCAQADPRTLLIQVHNREDRDSWVFCLNRAARLQPRDMWEFDEDMESGSGRYATVRPGRRKDAEYYEDMKEPGEKPQHRNRALKIVDKAEFWRRVVKGRERADTLVRELSVQSTLTAKCGQLPSILQLRGVFETSQNLILELELLEGHDLFEYISRKGVMDEGEACLVTEDVLRSLEAMHRVGVAHRDIKPANLLMCKGEDDRVAIKVGDFGMSAFVGVDKLVRGRCGTPGYAAPEILKASSGVGYGNQVDVFSAGVTLYVMLCGYEPFYGESEEALIEANKEAVVEFPKNDWSGISKDARDLIREMLKTDPGERITAKEALEHAWIQQFGSKRATDADANLQLLLADAPDAGACLIS